MCCGTPPDPNQVEARLANGIVLGHAYTLLSVHEITTRDGKIWLLKIRNPWGRVEWNGDWSDKSSKWTPALKRDPEIGWSDKEDGIFFMSEQDYLENYNMSTICYYVDGHDHSSVRASSRRGERKYFKITTDRDLRDIFFTCTQLSIRHAKWMNNYELSDARLIVGRVRDSYDRDAD